MNDLAYHRLTAMATTPEAQELAVAYLAGQMGHFLRKRDKVLICLSDRPGSAGRLIKEAVLRCDCVPQFLEQDKRWLTLLKTAFVTRSDAIVGPPMTMLGLAKVARQMGTPLFARNVLIGGYPCPKWMIDGIQQGLDCRVWRCYDPGLSAMIAGFSCPAGHIHLRQDRYRLRILSKGGNPQGSGKLGRVALSPLCDRELWFEPGDLARVEEGLCSCGCDSPRLMDLQSSNGIDRELSELWEGFHYWNSILDCKVTRSSQGLELELVVFPGKKLPRLPDCAKLLVRAWNPETDEPFPHAYLLKNQETH